jgi:hypothetical protein
MLCDAMLCYAMLCYAMLSQGAAEDSEDISPTHRFLVFTGTLYLLLGMLCFALPMVGVPLFTFGQLSSTDMMERELSMFRCCGAALLFTGYFHIQGGRGNSLHVISTVVFNQMFLHPCGMLVLWLLGARPEMCLFKGVFDPLLGLLTFASMHGVCIPYFAKGPEDQFRGNEILIDGVWLDAEARKAARMSVLDTDGDGIVSKEEAAVLDTDGDGTVTTDEMLAADTNGDGKISSRELQ